jgi:hypothetical protein
MFCPLGRISRERFLAGWPSGFQAWRPSFAETHGLNLRAFHALLKALRDIQKLPSANSVVICAVFFINPRYRVLI